MIRQAFETAGGDYSELSIELFGNDGEVQTHSKDARIDIRDISALWSGVHEKLNDPLFALKIGKNIHPSDYGIIGFVWMNCPTLLECSNSVVEFKKLMNDAFSASYEIKNNQYIYTLSVDGLDTEKEAAFINLDFSSICYLGRFLVGPRNSNKVRFNKVSLKQRYDNKTKSALEKILGCPVATGQKNNQIITNMDVLSLPIHAPVEAVQRMMLKKVKLLASNSYPVQSSSQRVVDFVNANMAGKAPSASTTAQHLGMSLSTLKRSLKNEGETFQNIVDKQRYRNAETLLKENKLSIFEISFLLGYSSPSSFTRSFKVWSSLNPKDYRRQFST